MNRSIYLFYLRRTFHLVCLCAAFILLTRSFVIETGVVNGRSMEPTLIDDNTFFVNKFIYLFQQPKRGDLISIKDPTQDKLYIKRVIGLPHERVSIRQGIVEITDEHGVTTQLDEPYLLKQKSTYMPDGKPMTTLPLPEHTYFVLGDNRQMSTDSRDVGTFHRNTIFGRVIIPFWKH